jgi:hypothetical protein
MCRAHKHVLPRKCLLSSTWKLSKTAAGFHCTKVSYRTMGASKRCPNDQAYCPGSLLPTCSIVLAATNIRLAAFHTVERNFVALAMEMVVLVPRG